MSTDSGDKVYIKSGSIGFPGEEMLELELLHDGKRKKKTAQLTVIHHDSGKVGYRLSIKDYESSNGSFVEKGSVPLDEEATEKLFQYLLSRENFAEIAQTTFYTLVESIAPLDKKTIEQLAKLLRRAVKNNQIESIMSADILVNFYAVLSQIKYKKAIAELTEMLKTAHSEKEYEGWFIKNHWIFGTEYLQPENVKIGWRTDGDIILTSVDGYQDIIELKLPTAEIFLWDESHKNWYPSSELSKAISQATKYIQESEDSRMLIESKEKVPFLKPRAKIVIGRSYDWVNDKKLDSLRNLNSQLHNIQIMTYDHLLKISEVMINNYDGVDAGGGE